MGKLLTRGCKNYSSSLTYENLFTHFGIGSLLLTRSQYSECSVTRRLLKFGLNPQKPQSLIKKKNPKIKPGEFLHKLAPADAALLKKTILKQAAVLK